MSPARIVPALCLSVTTALLAGCTAGPDEPGKSPEQTAADLAYYLSIGHIWGDLPLTAGSESAALAYPELINTAKGAWPTVTVDSVDPNSWASTRTAATLRWSWDIVPGGEPWTYSTKVDLVDADGMWRADVSMAQFHPELDDGEGFEVRQEPGERAEIVDRNSDPIMSAINVQLIGIDKPSVAAAEQEGAARELAELVEVDPDRFVEKVLNAGPKAFVSAITLRADDTDEGLLGALESIPGGRAVLDEAQLAPSRDFARPLLGTVGPATAELVEESKGRIAEGDEAGLSGLSRRYDEQLRGTGASTVTIDGEQVYDSEGVAGTPLQLSLDKSMQELADELVAGRDTPAALVAIQPSSQEILALASNPAADGQAIANTGSYPPGSTFKIVTALALLRSGMSPEDLVECPSTITVDGRTIGNYSDYPSDSLGTITLREAFAESCNTALIGEVDRLSATDLQAAASALGLNHDAELGYPFWLGEVPAAEDELDRAVSMIGQGEVLASPLGMAAVAASVQAGERVTPKLIMGAEAPALAQPSGPLTADEAEVLRGLMRGVVTDGSASELAELGDEVMAKTGTAEHGSDPVGTHAWMVGVDGDIAVAVFVADGKSGSSDAGPIMREFLSRK
ncbi:penicillin-binding transpeptidase domain-containing protein [Naumannella halotolerans]|uniref:penicillin-binding transpeptidase domain-containing protein n=1 Tax=Naumannella halotolerans TaxID=993414 RepID=UPI001415014A|nr:penicillin-binding transpeptidase domain-containing protein [Naumannella halotolerans]